MEKTNIQCGSFNERGFINSLKRKGFNFNRSVSELIQNSIDSGATFVKFIKNGDEEFILMDNGKGMTKLNLINMWDAYRENHTDDESGGVSGLGCKPSTFILSEQTDIDNKSIYLFADGIHFSNKGHRMISNFFSDYVINDE